MQRCRLINFLSLVFYQGRRWFLKSGTAIEWHRGSAKAEGSRGGAQGWVIPPFVRGARGISPEQIFEFYMSVEVILMHFETIFACKIRLIVQACSCIQMGFEPTSLKIEQLF